MANSSSLSERRRKAARPEMVKVSPGIYAPRHPEVDIPETGVGMFYPAQSGKMEFIPVQERWVRLTDEFISSIGMKGSRATLFRLARAGFIEIDQPSPGLHRLNLDSWYNHLARTAEDEEFWDRDGKNMAHYRESGAF